MSDSFKHILRTKNAEQLSNMYRNKESWSTDQYQLICDELKNRGLEIFEEPEEWSDEVMENVDVLNPQTEFEKDMAYLAGEKQKFEQKKGLSLASQIVSIASVFVGFTFFYLYIQSTFFLGITTTILISFMSISMGITAVILHILKHYLPAVIFGGVSLLLTLSVLLINLQRLI